MSLIIQLSQNGVTRRLSREADWREAIASRALTRDVELPIRRGGGTKIVFAGDVPELQAIFDELDPPAHRDVAAWVRRAAPLRAEPSTTASQIAELRRGEAVMMRLFEASGDLPAIGWVAVSAAGVWAYVKTDALSRTEPPQLQDGGEGEVEVPLPRAAELRREPLKGAAILESLPTGATVRRIGAVSDGWVEVLTAAGALGYLPRKAFEAPAPAPVVAARPPEPPPEPASPVADAPPLSPPQPSPKDAMVVGGAVKPSGTKKRSATPLVAGLTVLAVLGLALWLGRGWFSSSSTAEVGARWYAVRPVNVRSQPSAQTGGVLGRLDRGEAVVGVLDETGPSPGRFLRITEGEHQDAFVWTTNLSADARPNLSGGERRVGTTSATTLRAAPRDDAASVQTISAGKVLTVVGDVDDAWAEVALQAGGVAYAKRAVLAPERVVGSARMVDTGVVEINGRRLQLAGVSGVERPDFLTEANGYLARAQPVACEPEGTGWSCTAADDRNLGQLFVYSGFARADGPAFAEEEANAQAAAVGLWGS